MSNPLPPADAYLFPDNTVLCNFGTVHKLDLLAKVLDGRGRWTQAVAFEARRSSQFVPALRSVPEEGWLGDPVELSTDLEIETADRLRRVVFGGAVDEPLRHLGEAETLTLIQCRGEFASAVWLTDDGAAAAYARRKGIAVRDTVGMVREAVVGGLADHREGFRILIDLREAGRRVRGVPARAEELLY